MQLPIFAWLGTHMIIYASCFLVTFIYSGDKASELIDTNFVVSIKFRGFHLCGGSLITSTVAVSSAHCFLELSSERLHLQLWTIVAGTKSTFFGGIVKPINEVKIHENFRKPGNMSNDISLVFAAEAFVLNDQVNVVKIAPNFFQWPAGDLGRVMGWGKTETEIGFDEQLQYADITLFSKEYCVKRYGTDIIDSAMECAGSHDGKDACNGDSGGPLIYLKSGYLIGIISWGSGCGENDFPGVYTSVSHFNDWIDKNTKRNNSE